MTPEHLAIIRAAVERRRRERNVHLGFLLWAVGMTSDVMRDWPENWPRMIAIVNELDRHQYQVPSRESQEQILAMLDEFHRTAVALTDEGQRRVAA